LVLGIIAAITSLGRNSTLD